MTPKGVLGEAKFETLPAEVVARAEKSRAAARSFSDRVLHAFLLQDIGAAHDAREAWIGLARERPDLPELAGAGALSRPWRRPLSDNFSLEGSPQFRCRTASPAP